MLTRVTSKTVAYIVTLYPGNRLYPLAIDIDIVHDITRHRARVISCPPREEPTGVTPRMSSLS